MGCCTSKPEGLEEGHSENNPLSDGDGFGAGGGARNKRGAVGRGSVDAQKFKKHRKTAADTAHIEAALKDNLLTAELAEADRKFVIECMSPRTAAAGEVIITQGDAGHELFVLQAGFAIAEKSGEKVCEYRSSGVFGELALLYEEPRAATVTAKEACSLWVLAADVLKFVKRQAAEKRLQERYELLGKVKLLEQLSEKQMLALADSLEMVSFDKGQQVFAEGEEGDAFYIIRKGAVAVTSKVAGALTTLKAGQAFGELALLKDDTRAATVTAKDATECLTLSRKVLEDMLGPLQQAFRVQVLRGVSVLAPLSTAQLTQLAQVVEEQTFKSGAFVFKEGEAGDSLYLVNSGLFAVTVSGSEKTRLQQGDYFGELALFRNDVRQGSVRALMDSSTLCITRKMFNDLLGSLDELQRAFRLEVLGKVHLLESLSQEQLAALAGKLTSQNFGPGDEVLRQGDEGNELYILESGEVSVVERLPNGDEDELTTLGSGDYFGERALLKCDVRKASVRCVTRVSVLKVDRDTFESILGPLQHILNQQVDKYDLNMLKDAQLEDFKEKGVLGVGSFGKVTLVGFNERSFALKQIGKKHLVSKGLVKQAINERNLLRECHCPFLVNLLQSYKDKLHIYLLLEVVMGGELFVYMQENGRPLPEKQAKFYVACVVLAFEYLHARNIVYRDLKPENLLIDSNGYLKVADFSFAKILKKGKTYTMCGTPAYLAPELIKQAGHDKAVDWWAVGILVYELLNLVPPFDDPDDMVMYKKICALKYTFPKHFSNEAKDLIRRFLKVSPSARIGCLSRGAADIKKHQWFSSLDWDKVSKRQVLAPYVPKIKGDTDLSNFEDASGESVPGAHDAKRYNSIGLFDKF
mmetsp:Transcript_1014/g.3265  ORF Transcript_1014/g.3265 Transcript_1014/m.3265 type:complete len:865 (-) Transcript_1014:1193-3787(-)